MNGDGTCLRQVKLAVVVVVGPKEVEDGGERQANERPKEHDHEEGLLLSAVCKHTTATRG